MQEFETEKELSFFCLNMNTKEDETIAFTMETEMRNAGPICVLHFIAHDVACIASAIYAMVMRQFGPEFCIYFHCKRNLWHWL